MTDIIKIEVSVRTDFIGSKDSTVIEFEREDWESMTLKEKDEVCMEAMFGLIEWDYKEVE